MRAGSDSRSSPSGDILRRQMPTAKVEAARGECSPGRRSEEWAMTSRVLFNMNGEARAFRFASSFAARVTFDRLVDSAELRGFDVLVEDIARPGRLRARETMRAKGRDRDGRYMRAALYQRGSEVPQDTVESDPAVALALDILTDASVTRGYCILTLLGGGGLVEAVAPGVVSHESYRDRYGGRRPGSATGCG